MVDVSWRWESEHIVAVGRDARVYQNVVDVIGIPCIDTMTCDITLNSSTSCIAIRSGVNICFICSVDDQDSDSHINLNSLDEGYISSQVLKSYSLALMNRGF